MINAYLVLSWLYSFLFIWMAAKKTAMESADSYEGYASIFRGIFWLIFLFSVGRQSYLCIYGFQGFPTTDEYSFARIYTEAISGNHPIFGGFTQGVMAVGLSAWYQIFGPSIEAARFFAAFIGLSGVCLFWVVAKREFGDSVAYLSSSFLLCSGYFVLFSGLAIELVSVFLFPSLCLFFLRGRSDSLLRKIFALFLLAASFFTYPGVVLFWVSLALAVCILHRRKAINYLLESRGRNSAILFLAIFAAFIFSHFHFQASARSFSVQAGLFQGGGKFSPDLWMLLDSVLVNMIDVIKGGQSWYVDQIYPAPFLEPSLWGSVLVGVFLAWRKSDARLKVLSLTVLILFLGNLGISFAPGMRRAAALLPILYLFSAIGFLSLASQLKGYSLRALFFLPALLLAFSSFYFVPQLIVRASPRLTLPGNAIPDPPLLSTLELGDVYLLPEEFQYQQDFLAVLSGRNLEIRFGKKNIIGNVFLSNPPEDLRGKCAYLLSWESPRKDSVAIFSLRERTLTRSRLNSNQACSP